MITRTDLLNGLAKEGAYWNTGVTFKRTNPVPIENYSIFGTLAAAQDYALNNAVAYPGQTLAVVTDTNDVTLYIIQSGATKLEDTLKEVGSATLGDGLSIEITADNVLKLRDYGTQYYAYKTNVEEGEDHYVLTTGWKAGLEPKVRLTEEGKYVLAWYEPNPTTVEGLNSEIASLKSTVTTMQEGFTTTQNQVGTLNTTVSGIAPVVESNTGRIDSAEDRIDVLETAVGKVYTREETDNKIATEIGKQAHFSSKVVLSTDEMTDNNVIYLLKDTESEGVDKYYQYIVIEGVATCIGDTSTNLDGYATESWVEGKGYAVADDVAASVSGLQDNIDDVDAKFDDYSKTSEIESLVSGTAETLRGEIATAVKVATDGVAANTDLIGANTQAIEDHSAAISGANDKIAVNIKGIQDVNARVDNVVNDITSVNTRIDQLGGTYATDTELGQVRTDLENAIENASDALTAQINKKADADKVYTKEEVDSTLEDYYTGTQADAAIAAAVSAAVADKITLEQVGTYITSNRENVAGLLTADQEATIASLPNKFSGIDAAIAAIPVIKTSDHIALGEDGKLSITKVPVSTLDPDVILLLDCGSSAN